MGEARLEGINNPPVSIIDNIGLIGSQKTNQLAIFNGGINTKANNVGYKKKIHSSMHQTIDLFLCHLNHVLFIVL